MIEILTAIVFAAGAGALAFWWHIDYRVRIWSDRIALVALFFALTTAAGAVIRTILHNTIFMTEVHMVLLNPFFIVSGACLSFYWIATALAGVAGIGRWAVRR